MDDRIIQVKAFCSNRKSPNGLQFIAKGNDGSYEIGGQYAVYATSATATREENEVINRFYLGNFKTKGCRVCGDNHYLYACHDCGVLACYDGKAGRYTCPSCGHTNPVPATKDDRIVQSGGGKVFIMLAIDTSGSMSTRVSGQGFLGSLLGSVTLLDDVKQSAEKEFLDKIEGAEFGLVEFSDYVSLSCPLTTDKKRVASEIRKLRTHGGTTGPIPYVLDDKKLADFRKADGKKYLVIFTDGAWFNDAECLKRAPELKQLGVDIITIATKSGADHKFLGKISTASVVTEGSSASAFMDVAKRITQG